MGEPLKDKWKQGQKGSISKQYYDDARLAVEWLKERIKSMDIPKGKNQVLETIDIAFQDLNTQD